MMSKKQFIADILKKNKTLPEDNMNIIMKLSELTPAEKKIIANEEYLRRIQNYDYTDIIELITTAWIDTDEKTIPDEDYTDAFIEVCEVIREKDVLHIYGKQ